MNIRNLTLEEINTAPATKVAEWLAECTIAWLQMPYESEVK